MSNVKGNRAVRIPCSGLRKTATFPATKLLLTNSKTGEMEEIVLEREEATVEDEQADVD